MPFVRSTILLLLLAANAFGQTRNTAPSITQIANQTIDEDASTGALQFTVRDAETPADQLTVSAISSNTQLVSANSISFGGSGNSRTITVTPLANQSGAARITVTVSDGSLQSSMTFTLTVNAVNDPPTISQIPDQTTNEDTPTAAIPFTVDDIESGPSNLTLSADSSNTALVGPNSIVFGGSGANRTVTITPLANQFGSALIVITVSDGAAQTSTRFTLNVTSVNDPPTISQIASQTILQNGSTTALPFTIDDADNDPATLRVTGVSSNPNLAPDANITFGGSGANRTVTVTPAQNQSGSTTITLTVTDGAAQATTSFGVTVTAVNQPPTISLIADQTTNEDTPTGAIPFTIGDNETPPDNLSLSARSSNPALVPDTAIQLGGAGANRTITLTPAPDQFGSAAIRITVSDGAAQGSSAFILTVAPVNDAPTISAISDRQVAFGGSTGPIPFTVGDVDNDPATLRVTGVSSNPTLIADTAITFGGDAGNRTVTLVPTANQTGNATITLSVVDAAGISTSTSFLVTVTATQFDFGDAPSPYPTLLANNGARHRIVSGFHLGPNIDAEPDGQPNKTATGDDATATGAAGDEDGVKFLTSPMLAGQTAQVAVTLTGDVGRLDAWIDFNGNGSWADPGDQIFRSVPLKPGANLLTFTIPADAIGRATFARFRLSLQGGLGFSGAASDGEVEDYQISIERPAVDLLVEKRDSPDPVLVGDNLLYTIVIANVSGNPATQVTLTDIIPPGLNVIGANTDQGSCAITAGKVVCDLGTIGPNTPITVKILAVPTQPGAITNIVAVASTEPDTNPNNNTATAVTTVIGRQIPDCDDRSSRGSDFWLTFPGNYAPDPANPVQLSLNILGSPGTSGTVEIPGLGFSSGFLIPASFVATVVLPKEADLGNSVDAVEAKGIHVLSKGDVAVFGLNRVFYTSDGYAAFPVSTLGTDYLIQGFGNVHSGVPALNGTQFAIVGTEDGTKVTITPSVTTAGHTAGAPYSLALNRGQTYQLRAKEDAPSDLTGSQVTADRPIAVFGGNQCAFVPDKSVLYCDYVVEQLMPVSRAGLRFVTIPLATRLGGDLFRFLALQDGTTVKVNGTNVATLNHGEFAKRIIADPAQIVATKPIFVSRFSTSAGYDGTIIADPFMMLVPHVNQFLNQQFVFTPDSGFKTHFLNVVAPNPAVGSVVLDGSVISPAEFAPIGGSGFSGAQIKVKPGAHQLSANLPFGVSAYGFAEFDSYGYIGELFFGDTVSPTVTCTATEKTVVLSSVNSTVGLPQCQVPVPDFREGATVTDDCQMPERVVLSQDPPPGTLVGPGDHEVVVSAKDAHGNVGTCTVVFHVIDPSPLLLSCPQDIFASCTTPEGARVPFQVSAQKKCDTNIRVECSPAPGSFFPIGTTVVQCKATDSNGNVATCSFRVTVECKPITIAVPAPGQVQIQWVAGQTLESAPAVNGPWTAVTTSGNSYSESTTKAPKKFFRVK